MNLYIYLVSSFGIDDVNHLGRQTPATDVDEYEVPVVSLSNIGRSTSQGANTNVCQDTSQPYETPMTTSRNSHMDKHIYHILETPTEVILYYYLWHKVRLYYRSVTKKSPWVVHLTCHIGLKREGGPIFKLSILCTTKRSKPCKQCVTSVWAKHHVQGFA